MKFKDLTIISDLDGTLLTEDKKISKENLEAIKYFRDNGGTFTLASGRIYSKMILFSDILEFINPMISHNGAVIYDLSCDKVMHKVYLEGDYKNVIKEIYNEYPFIGVEAFTEHDVMFFKYNEFVKKHIEDENFAENSESVVWHDFSEETPEWCKILMANSPADNDILENILPKKYLDFQFVRSEAHYYEILPAGISKGTATKRLMEIMGKPMDKLYAIGDNMNDLELVKAAKTGIAVKNASENLKKSADIILDRTNEENAVARVIELIDKGEI